MTCINYQPINATLKLDFWHLLHTEMAKKLKFTLLTPNTHIIIGFYEIFYFRTPKREENRSSSLVYNFRIFRC